MFRKKKSFCLGDWLKVKEGGPWLFRQNAFCIEEYDGLSSREIIDLNFFDTWIQIHKLTVGGGDSRRIFVMSGFLSVCRTF
jgi:hypothetical protein